MTENGNGQPDRIDEIMNLLVGFIDETRQFMAEQKQFNAEQKQFNAKVTEDISRLTREVGQLTDDVGRLTDDVGLLTNDVGRLTNDVSRLTDDVSQLTDDVSQLKRLADDVSQLTDDVGQLKRLADDVSQLTDDVGQLKRLADDVSQLTDDVGQLKRLTDDVSQLTDDVGQLKRLTDDVGQLKGFHVRAVALQRTGSIAKNLDLSEFHILTHDEIGILANRLGRLPDFDVEENDRLSFAAADMIIEAHDKDRIKHYIAAEISYTANRDDVRRVVRNAGYLRMVTSSTCHAVVIGCEKTADVDDAIADRSISWHIISNRAMAPV